jgi:hypothetical protein
MAVPNASLTIGVSGKHETASSRPRMRLPSPGPSTRRHNSTLGHFSSAASATERRAIDEIRTFDWLLSTM